MRCGKIVTNNRLEVTEMEEEEMSKLFTFLENFDIENEIKILSEAGEVLFEGKMGDVPQRITNMMSVIRGTADYNGKCLAVKVKKS